MNIEITENKLIRLFIKGSPVFFLVLLVGLFPYVWTLKHDFEAARAPQYDSRLHIQIGTVGRDKPSFTASELAEYLRQRIAGDLKVERPEPNKAPNLVVVIAEMPGDKLRSMIGSFLEQKERPTERSRRQLQDEIEIRTEALDSARAALGNLETATATENEATPETIETIKKILRLENEIEGLNGEREALRHSEVDLVLEDESGGQVWTIWRTISAIIGSLGVIYFAAISGLAFGYILDRRA